MKLAGIWELKKIAMRNLARHKIKTTVTVLAIMVSTAVYIFMSSWLGGMGIESRRNIVNYEIGAAKLQTKLYFEKKDELPSYENFAGWEIYRGILDNAGYNAAPRYVFSGTLYAESGTAPVLINAVDPEAEAEVLRYVSYIESGRYIQNGAIEVALGTMVADKLQVGIPQRPLRQDLISFAASLARNSEEQDFILSLYDPVQPSEGWQLYLSAEETTAGNERMLLKKNIPQADMERYWNLVAESGRNNVQISAIIDMKAAPEKISPGKWEDELIPALTPPDQLLIQAAYQYEEMMDTYLLNVEVEADEAKMEQVLAAMIRADFSGAVRHVNQLFPAVVVGVINSPDPLTNSNIAYIPLDVLQGEEGMMLEGHITELLIRDKNGDAAELPGERESAASISAALERGLAEMGKPFPPELAVFTWLDYSKDFLGYEAMENGSGRALSILLFVLAFLGISNTILLAVMERTKEIGMMRAMGMTEGQMVQVYMLEAGFLGLIGAVLGMAIGCLINYPMVKYGMDVSGLQEAMGGDIGFRVTSRFRSMWNFPMVFGTGAVAVILSSFMAFFPSRRAVKMPITDSLRFE